MDSAQATTTTARTPALEGIGRASAHHGELLQGVFASDGHLRRGLTTLPCPVFGTRARVRLDPASPVLEVRPAWKVKALAAARGTLAAIGRDGQGGTVTIDSDIHVGQGLGSSSSDVIAVIRAVTAATGVDLPAEDVARIAVTAESATDPLMFGGLTLFAQREGHVIEDFGRPILPLEVLGFSTGRGEVDTLAMPDPEYTPEETARFALLRALVREATRTDATELLGRVATASARINERLLPVPRFAGLVDAVDASGAVGLQVAHSGAVAGLLYDTRHPDLERRVAVGARRLAQLSLRQMWRFTTV